MQPNFFTGWEDHPCSTFESLLQQIGMLKLASLDTFIFIPFANVVTNWRVATIREITLDFPFGQNLWPRANFGKVRFEQHLAFEFQLIAIEEKLIGINILFVFCNHYKQPLEATISLLEALPCIDFEAWEGVNKLPLYFICLSDHNKGNFKKRIDLASRRVHFQIYCLLLHLLHRALQHSSSICI